MPIFLIFWHLLVAKKVGRQDITDGVSSFLALSNKYMSAGLVFLEMFREGDGGRGGGGCQFCVTSRNFDYMLSMFIEVITCTYCIIYMAWHCNTGSRDN